jgi:endonuclease-8
MPEGDTIFRSARALERVLSGNVVTGFETNLAKLARVNDDTPLIGRTIDKVESRGKWLLIHFSGDLILVTHMLMSGSWHIYRTGERWKMGRSSMRAVIRTADWEAVAFNVPIAEFFTARTLERYSQIPKLGPDILSSSFTVEAGVERFVTYASESPHAEIGNALLNQRVLAGLGNVYKSEVAFAAKVHPFRHLETLTRTEMERLVDHAHRYIKANVNDGEDTLILYSGKRRTTHAMDRRQRLWVYERQGEECRRCGSIIMMRRQSIDARSTFWCPECQPWVGEGEAPIGRSHIIRRGRTAG